MEANQPDCAARYRARKQRKSLPRRCLPATRMPGRTTASAQTPIYSSPSGAALTGSEADLCHLPRAIYVLGTAPAEAAGQAVDRCTGIRPCLVPGQRCTLDKKRGDA